jgi:hypothetical protein
MPKKKTYKRPAFGSPETQLGERIGPGLWIDKAGHPHFSIPEILQHEGLPDTPANRRIVEEALRELIEQATPGAECRRVDNRLDLPYPDGLPLYWRDEQTDSMKRVVQAFLSDASGGATMDSFDYDLFKAYLIYVVEAPCWKGLDRKRFVRDIELAQDAHAISGVIQKLLDCGIDPI